MDASVSKILTSVSTLVSELDETMTPFRDEMQALLNQLQTSHTNQQALTEKVKSLTSELDAARVVHSEVKSEEDELSSALKQLHEDTARLQEENQKSRLVLASTENALREAKGKIASLESLKECGSGWTGDQIARKEELLKEREAVVHDLHVRRTALNAVRAEVSLLNAQIDRAQQHKIEADRAIASLKDEIADAKQRTATTNRLKDVKERELKELQEVAALALHELNAKSKASEEGGSEVSKTQELVRQDKAALDRCLKDYDKLRARAMKLADELESQMKINKTLTLELKQLSDGAADARAEATRVQKEAIRLKKLHELCTQKIEEAEERRSEGEGKLQELQRQIEDIDAASEAERRRNDVKRQALDDLRREKDVLSRSIGTAGDKSRDAEETVTLQGSIRRNLQAEVTTYAATLKTMRDELDELLAQKAQYAAQSEEAQQAYFTALEGVKLQELQMAALQRKIEEGNAKLKQQQSLYDAVKADRNLYSKNLADANSEISDMRRMYKQLSHTIDSVKGDIETKDVNLIKEHYEHHRVEKDKESLRNELTRVQKQIQSCEQILTSQESEISKLNAIIAEADAEKMRQSKEYESVLAEKNLLQSQLVKRDSELAALYERLRVQKSSLANGAAAYAKTHAERDDLKARISALKGELLVSDTQTSDVKALENEAKRLDGDLRAEKMKIRALTEELERPINIHRWRALADRDPERWALLQRIHALQKRVLESRDNIREREVAIAEKEKQYGKLKTALARQPGPDISETIASYQATLKAKTKQLRALEGELDSYRSRVEEYKRERTRINESLEKASQDYVRRMKMQRKRLSTVNSSIAASSYVPMDDASLMDISAEMAAAGMEPSTYGNNNMLPPGQAESVKNEADRILAAYADVLGDDVTHSNMLESKE